MPLPHPAAAAIAVSSPEAGLAALRTFFNIVAAWKLPAGTQMAILGLRSRATFNRWKQGEGGALSPDTIERQIGRAHV